MSVAEHGRVEAILGQLKDWPTSDRLRLARMILETLEAKATEPSLPSRSMMDLVGMLKTEATPPTDEECRAILEDELIERHFR